MRTVVEDVSQVGVAFLAGDGNAIHSERVVVDLAHIFLGDRSPEARPSSAGIEFGFGAEQGVVAADAAVEAFVVQVPIFAGVSEFGVGVTRNFEGAGGKQLAP